MAKNTVSVEFTRGEIDFLREIADFIQEIVDFAEDDLLVEEIDFDCN
jgi:hypothetical protein